MNQSPLNAVAPYGDEGSSFVESNVTRKGNFLLGLLLMGVFFVLPWYLFSSGGLQLVDIPMVFIMMIALFNRNIIDVNTKKDIASLLPFVLWAIIINSGYFLVYSNDYWYILSAAALAYGLLLIYIYAIIFKRLLDANGIIYIYLALLLSIIGCFVIKGYVEEGRTTLSFNNPNQLAYFAVILLGYAILLLQLDIYSGKKPIFYSILDIIFIVSAHFFAIVSYSRAGLIAIAILDISLIRSLWKMRLLFPTAIAGLIVISYFTYIKPEIIQSRLDIHSEEDFTADRLLYGRDGVMDRVLGPLRGINGLEILIGKGAGLRHEMKIKHKKVYEVHNSFVEVLKCYGVIGLLLFLFWFIRLSWGSLALKNGIWIMAAMFAYNFGHMGLRFRSFWIYLGMFVAIINLANFKKTGQRNQFLQNRNMKSK